MELLVIENQNGRAHLNVYVRVNVRAVSRFDPLLFFNHQFELNVAGESLFPGNLKSGELQSTKLLE